MRSILDFTSSEAQAFFLKGESYSNVDLPSYFDFNYYIGRLYKELAGKSSMIVVSNFPSQLGKVQLQTIPAIMRGLAINY